MKKRRAFFENGDPLRMIVEFRFDAAENRHHFVKAAIPGYLRIV